MKKMSEIFWPTEYPYSLSDRRYTTMWCIVFIMQLSTERHVSALQGHHQAYKIMVLVKVHAVVLLYPYNPFCN